MAVITGNITDIFGASAPPQPVTLKVALRGYGSQIPRIQGQALYGIIENEVATETDGSFEFAVTGNDQIAPAGTYYTVELVDENGDTLQINAYVFLGSDNYNLDNIDPYDPNQPPPPLPPLIYDQLLEVPSSAAPNFPGDQYTAFRFYVNEDVAASSISGMVPGNLYTFIITQDATTGGWEFAWPGGVWNATPVCPTPNSSTIQTFIAAEDGSLYSIAPGTYWIP